MVMKPPSFNGKGPVLTFLAKFDNCGEYKGWTEKERLHYLTNALENPAVQVLWDLQSGGAVTYKRLRAILVKVFGSRGQEEVYELS